MTRLDTLDFGAPITPTPAEVSAAYTRVGAMVPWLSLKLAQRMVIREAASRLDGDDRDPSRGVVWTSVCMLVLYVAFAKVVLS